MENETENGFEFLRDLSELMTKHNIIRVELSKFDSESIEFISSPHEASVCVKNGDTPEKIMADYHEAVKFFEDTQ